MAKTGDIIKYGRQNRPHKILRVLGNGKIVVLQEMAKDKLGRLRSIGEEGRFSATRAVLKAPLYKSNVKAKKRKKRKK